MINRRDFLGFVGTGLLMSSVGAAEKPANPTRDAAFASFDKEMEEFMAGRNIPGGALAVARNGRLVYARGYGWADREKEVAVAPESLFRIASISKPITAAAVLQLVEQGKINLHDRAFDLIHPPPILRNGDKPDPRLREITISHLLHHTGGWDRDKSYDPMFRCKIIAATANTPEPPDPLTVIRYMLGQPLDFDPGTCYAYSNFGYCVLGRIIEKVTGKSYEAFVKESVLAPIEIKRMRLGASLQSSPGEVSYYQSKDTLSESVFPAVKEKVPMQYGGFCLESMDAHGGWIASAVDLARFAAALDLPEGSPLLKPESLKLMAAPPAPPVSRNAEGKLNPTYYGCGWMIRPVGQAGKSNQWHNGALTGTSTMLVRRADGLSWAVLFNQRAQDMDKIDAAMHRAASGVTEWPSHNLFARFP